MVAYARGGIIQDSIPMFTYLQDPVDDMEDIVMAFMMVLITWLMLENATSCWQREISSAHNSSLQGMHG